MHSQLAPQVPDAPAPDAADASQSPTPTNRTRTLAAMDAKADRTPDRKLAVPSPRASETKPTLPSGAPLSLVDEESDTSATHMPNTPRNCRALVTGTTPRVTSAPASVPLPRRRGRSTVGYIPSPDTLSPLDVRQHTRSEPQSPSRRGRPRRSLTEDSMPEPVVAALVRECEESISSGGDVSALNSRVLHAVAAKERRCLELREELAREDALLNDLRTAWKRIAMRGVPGASAASPRPTPAPLASKPVHSASARPANDMSAAAATALGSAEVRRGRRTSALMTDSWNTIQRQIETHITPLVRVSDEAPPVPPKEEATVRSVASERLAYGWNTLSRRLRETAMKIGDTAQWVDEGPRSEEELATMRAALDDPSWRISGMGSTPLTAGPGVGALGMLQKWGEEQWRAKALPEAPADKETDHSYPPSAAKPKSTAAPPAEERAEPSAKHAEEPLANLPAEPSAAPSAAPSAKPTDAPDNSSAEPTTNTDDTSTTEIAPS
ncbi:hypothetical protein MCUN1_000263 [Malassezia cuniculi]|uniref:Uncharacterized protein n=1 Tax=Malassezia cuniculi TaxID=948313 RepID=A0AAF0J4V8_9BASI|nr:hypothetical protein MCUN1_000263 [Malassezia cuniculi]